MRATAFIALLSLGVGEQSRAARVEHVRLIAIVSRAQTVSDVSLGDLRRIYVAEITRWPSGHRIIPVMLTPEREESQMFLRHVVKMSAIDYAQEWIGAVFRGRVSAPPVMVSNAADAARFVAAHADAIAFVPATASLIPDVRILRIDHRLPDDDEYPLAW